MEIFGLCPKQGRRKMVECNPSSNWKVIQGSIDATVKVTTGSDEPQAFVAPLVLEQTPDSRSCEVTVEFHGTLAVESISIVSASRQCEVYFVRAEETEYICTRRGEVDGTENGEPYYKVELDFEGAGSCVGVKLKLLSLVKSKEASVRRIAICGTPEATPMAVKQRGTTSGLEPGIMKTMMPSMLQMLRGMSNGIERSRKEELPRGRYESTSKPSSSSAVEDQTVQKADKSFQDEISHRLQRLEMAVASMNSFIQFAFGKLDQRLECLEKQISTLQPCAANCTREAESGETETTSTSMVCTEVSPPQATDEALDQEKEKVHQVVQNEDEPQTHHEQVDRRERMSLVEDHRDHNLGSEDEQVSGSEKTQTENEEVLILESDRSSVGVAVPLQRSVSLEGVWSSSLEAFSNSAPLDIVHEKLAPETESDADITVETTEASSPEARNVHRDLESTSLTEAGVDESAETGITLDGSYELCEIPATIEGEAITDLIDWSEEVRSIDACTSIDTADCPQVSFIDSICEAPSVSATVPDSNVAVDSYEPVQTSSELISIGTGGC